MKVAAALVQAFKDEGTDIVFGICGGYLFWLLRAFDQAGVRTIPSRHEGAAAFMAAGYTQASGKLGIVFAQGPGAINTLTGVASAYCDSTPLLVMASQAPQAAYAADAHQEATGSNFGVEQADAFKPMTRAVFRCPSSTAVLRTVRRALAIAHGEHGPVMLEIPANILGEEIEPTFVPPDAYRVVPRHVDQAGVERTAELVARASRPVLLIGNRCTHRGMADELRALCEEASLPFAVTDYSKGIIPEDHPLYLGVIGQCGHESAHESLEAADLVIAVGARLDSKTTVNHDAKMFENLVQIDEIAAEIGRNFPLALGVLGDLPATIAALRRALLGPHDRKGDAFAAEARRKHRVFDEPLATDATGELRTAVVMHVLREKLPRTALIVGDSGLNLHYVKRFLPVLRPDGFFCFYGWAAMGSGLPVAMGVQIARPDDVVVLVIGDGGLLVYAGELQVMAEYNLPVVVVVINNAGYQQVGEYMARFMGTRFGCPIEEIDAAHIGRAFGCDGYTVRTAREVADAVDTAVARRRPAVIDVKVTGDRLEDIMLERSEQFVRKIYGKSSTTRA